MAIFVKSSMLDFVLFRLIVVNCSNSLCIIFGNIFGNIFGILLGTIFSIIFGI